VKLIYDLRFTNTNTNIFVWHLGTNDKPKVLSVLKEKILHNSDSKMNFYIPQLDRHRNINVLLPKGYEQGNQRYPVIYMQDGQNLSDAASSFAGTWNICRTLEKLPKKKQVIIVGIDHGGEHRINEYAPYRRGSKGGEGDAYIRFIIETLKPFIDAHYRSLTDKRNTSIVGSSMGGLIAFYAILKYPQVFGNAGIFSPALWFNPKVLDLVANADLSSEIYMAGSKTESKGMEPILQKIYWLLRNTGFSDSNIRIVVRDRGKHNEVLWGREFAKFLEWAGDID
jgi:predicted alpha/beta superfamily hydrolase